MISFRSALLREFFILSGSQMFLFFIFFCVSKKERMSPLDGSGT